jgi:hypothetical protein
MPPEPVPADPGWDEDLTWLDRDPERESWLDRAREHDDPPEPEEYDLSGRSPKTRKPEPQPARYTSHAPRRLRSATRG